MVQFSKLNSAMETRDHLKNGTSLKSQMSKVIFFIFFLSIISLTSCKVSEQHLASALKGMTGQVLVNTEPSGAKVIVNGVVVCESTPCTVTVPVDGTETEFTFIKNGYESGKELLKPDKQFANNRLTYQYHPVFHIFKGQTPPSTYTVDPTIRAGEASNMVSRDKPGGTALERTIIHWYFDSEPRGARIFWRVISSIPDQVKNTNELYLTSTPYEETRSFNILGLTYENSRDVVVEIKVTKPGYMDQVKRYNVRQSIDQQEISGFFDLVKQD